MKRAMNIVSVTAPLAFLIGCTTAGAAATSSCANPVGAWKNHLTSPSTLTIKSIDTNTGAISGTYRSPSGTTGQDYPLIGWMNQLPAAAGKDNAVILSFSVRWGSYGTVTSWTGVCRTTNNQSLLSAMWFLGQPVTDFDWQHVQSGQDVFDPVTQ